MHNEDNEADIIPKNTVTFCSPDERGHMQTTTRESTKMSLALADCLLDHERFLGCVPEYDSADVLVLLARAACVYIDGRPGQYATRTPQDSEAIKRVHDFIESACRFADSSYNE